MVGVLVDLLGLEHLGDVVLETVSPVHGFVAVAGYLEGFVVHTVFDEGDVGHLHDGVWLFEHGKIL